MRTLRWWVDFQAGERVWVVNAPHPIYRAGQRPSRNAFSDFSTRGQFCRDGVRPMGHDRRILLGFQQKRMGLAVGHTHNRRCFDNMAEDKEGKRKFALYIRESTLEQVRKWYPMDNCTSQSEFIEKAVQFYIGFISSDNGSDYLPKIIISTLKGIVNESDNRISRILFKLAVEQAITMNVVAATCNISRDQLDKLRGTCVSQVKRSNGAYSFEDAYDLQKR